MRDIESLKRVFDEIQLGAFDAALRSLASCREVLGTSYASEWWRLKGLTHTHLSDWSAAEEAYLQAVTLAAPRGGQHGAALVGYGSLLGKLGRRSEAMELYLKARDVYRSCRFDQGLVLAGYNLGWSLLELNRVDDAARAFEDVILTAQRPAGAYHRPYLHLGRSLVATLRGDLDLAIAGARWTVDRTSGLMQVRSLRHLAETCWLAGDEEAAYRTLVQAEAIPAARESAHQWSRLRLLRAVLNGDREAVDCCTPSLFSEDQVRALVFMADLDWRQDRFEEALKLLTAAVDVGQPHVLALVRSRFGGLFAWGRDAGLPLPTGLTQGATREIRVRLRGRVGLKVNGYAVHARLTVQGAALVAFLDENGPSSQVTVLKEALGSARSSDVTKAAERVNLLIGDPEAIVFRGEGASARWQLSDRWTWTMACDGVGTLLPGMDSPFTSDLMHR